MQFTLSFSTGAAGVSSAEVGWVVNRAVVGEGSAAVVRLVYEVSDAHSSGAGMLQLHVCVSGVLVPGMPVTVCRMRNAKSEDSEFSDGGVGGLFGEDEDW